MDKPISIGDMVVIVRGCCTEALSQAVGIHTTVVQFYDNPGRLCQFCNAPTPSRRAELSHQKWNAPVVWLKRIPPPEELDIEKHEEEITA